MREQGFKFNIGKSIYKLYTLCFFQKCRPLNFRDLGGQFSQKELFQIIAIKICVMLFGTFGKSLVETGFYEGDFDTNQSIFFQMLFLYQSLPLPKLAMTYKQENCANASRRFQQSLRLVIFLSLVV